MPPNETTGGLNFGGITPRPVKGVVVEVINAATQAVLATTSTSSTGAYSANVPASTQIFVRVRARLLKTGAAPNWNITIKDNTNGNAAYVVDTAAFNSGTAAALTRDVSIASGWTGANFGAPRASGPFAITNTMFDAVSNVVAAAPTTVLPELQVLWSVNNVASPTTDLATGQVSTSFFTIFGGVRSIVVLGKADNDSDEFDESVITHEFGHYLQNAASRDDSVGGQHGGLDKLDARVAFSEGWGNAWAGMSTGRTTYTDSVGIGAVRGLRLDLTRAETASNKGWFSETSVQFALFRHFQQSGFAPIWRTLTNTAFTSGTPVTTIHSFAAATSAVDAAAGASLAAILAGENIRGDGFAVGETNDGGLPASLPFYKTATPAVMLNNVCLSQGSGTPNKLGNYAYVRVNIPNAATWSITVAGAVGQDPDYAVFQNGAVGSAVADSTATGSETSRFALATGPAVIVFNDFNLSATSNKCFSVMIAP